MIYIFFGLAIALIIFSAFLDWQAGASSSYIHDDGTIREWDRFGNVCMIDPDGEVSVHIEDDTRGLGPLYASHGE